MSLVKSYICDLKEIFYFLRTNLKERTSNMNAKPEYEKVNVS